MNGPKISIVMPSYKQSAYIKDAIESVLSQSYDNKEVIIIDGGSTDGAVDVIKSYDDQIAYWVSEPDKGQSNALNKGFRVATGDLMTWMNTDDILLPGALKKVAHKYSRRPDSQWIAGGTVRIDEYDRILRCVRRHHFSRLLWAWGMMGTGSPSAFWTRTVYKRIGEFREDLHLRMDADMWCRFVKAGVKLSYVDDYLWCFRCHRGGKTTSEIFVDGEMDMSKLGTPEKRAESRLVREEHFPNITPMKERIALLVARGRKVLSGSYLISRWDTHRLRGKKWQDVFLSEDERR